MPRDPLIEDTRSYRKRAQSMSRSRRYRLEHSCRGCKQIVSVLYGEARYCWTCYACGPCGLEWRPDLGEDLEFSPCIPAAPSGGRSTLS